MVEFGIWSLVDLISKVCFAVYFCFRSHRWLFSLVELQFLHLHNGENTIYFTELLDINENLCK